VVVPAVRQTLTPKPSNRNAAVVENLAPAVPSSTLTKKISELISVPTQKVAVKTPPVSPNRPLDLPAYKNEDLRSLLGMMNVKIHTVITAFETQRHVTKETKGAITDLAALNARAIQLQEGADKEVASRNTATQMDAQQTTERPAAPPSRAIVPRESHRVKAPTSKPPKLSVPKTKEQKPSSYANVAKDASKKEEWAKVMPKRLRKKPEALIVKKTGEASYADMLRKLKADPSLSDMGKQVRTIRRTQQGELLIEVYGKASASVPTIRGAIEESLKDMAAVRTGAQRVALTCSGMDEAATAEELQSCLASQYEGILVKSEDVRGWRKMRDGTQTATVMLGPNDAITVLKRGSVTVGWSRCRIVQDIRPTRCYRCLGYGHRATNCKLEDRSDCCLRCGEHGHKAKGCVAPPRCLICSSDVDRKHATGSFACPTYKASVGKGAKSRQNDAGPN
jgi:hypothetical protein